MRVVFMGTPDFAVPSLQALHENGYEVTLVVTQTDKPQGRKQILTPSPVKEYAVRHHIPVYQPKTLRTQEAYDAIAAEKPDFIVVTAYGKILTKEILDLPVHGCVNVHGSLLPQYRGAAPIQWSVLNGDPVTGITTMLMDEGIDTGDILLQHTTQIGKEETAGELFDRLAGLSAPVLLETLDRLVKGEIVPRKQEEEKACYVSMLKKEMALIDWSLPAEKIHNLVRGMHPWPVAFTSYCGKTLKVHACQITQRTFGNTAGEAIAADGGLFVRCGDGVCLQLHSVQLEGAKRMNAADFLRGHSIDKNCILGQ